MAEAKYYPIYKKLKKRIKNKEYEEMLPTEQILAEEFNTSRNTIRRVITMLKNKGLVYSVKGRGVLILETFSDTRWSFDASGFSGLEATREENSIDTNTKVITFKKIITDEDLEKHSPFKLGEVLYLVERLRVLNEEPTMLDISYFRFNQVPDLTNDIVQNSIYQYLESQNIQIAISKRRFFVTSASGRDNKLLALGNNNCVGIMENLVFNDKGRLFEYTQSRFIPDRFSLSYFVQNS